MAVSVNMAVFRFAQCSLVEIYRRSKGDCYLYYHSNEEPAALCLQKYVADNTGLY
jgi:hypothetical protein